ncbi:MAG: hypothetical protein K6F37_00065 [Lachnospiraceae bacterium]|nr:hypothetical protein [Lachnospiraceae bacterium]
MTTLLEIKEKLRAFYAKYDIYIKPALKFLLALVVYIQINGNIGYNSKIESFPITLVLALLGAILPIGATVFIAAIVILLHLYALSFEVAIIGFILFVMVYFLYFRFSPKKGMNVLLMPICLKFRVGSVVPVTSGLVSEWYSAISIVSGTLVYYFLLGIKENASTLGAETDEGITYKFTAVINQLVGNKQMYLAMVTFALTTLVVYTIRKLSANYSWYIAIITGLLVNFIMELGGKLMLGISLNLGFLLLETAVTAIVAFIVMFMTFNLDYTRVERVQFEDDDYYYYVKAVPKIFVAEKEKTVKTISTKKKKSRSDFTKEDFEEQMGRNIEE